MSDNATKPTIAVATTSGLVEVVIAGVEVSDSAITVQFDMPSSVHDGALEAGWFHLGPLSAGGGARPFGPDGEVRIEARLDPRLVPGLLQVVDTPAGVSELIGAFDESSPLHSEASWYACAATQEVPIDDDQPELLEALDGGYLREGYRTAWGSGTAGGGLPIVAYLAELLERRFQNVEPLDEQPGFRWSLSGSDASWTTTAIIDEEVGWCVLYSIVDGSGADADRDALVDRANDLNQDLLFGAWHVLDAPMSVCFRSSLELPDRVAAEASLDRLVTRHLDIVDEYAPSFT